MENEITFSQIEMAAKREQWDFVDVHLKSFIDAERVFWALNELQKGQNRNARDLAATILDLSDVQLSQEDIKTLEAVMSDHMEYHIVRYRIAIALYKRGVRTDTVTAMVQEAYNDPDVGERARDVFKAT